ncbi:MAG TPA: hypothetical protein VF659_18485 [Pyrinomonadaceae bacterium]|jgi:hypothetical protein
MKHRLLLACAAVLLSGGAAGAQKSDLGRVPLRTATLVSHAKQKDYRKSVFNFEHGVRGDQVASAEQRRSVSLKGLPNNQGLVTRYPGENPQDTGQRYSPSPGFTPFGMTEDTAPARADRRGERFDIHFGGLTFNGDSNWLQIPNRAGTRSVLKDLGALDWAELKSLPVLEPSPAPHTGGVTFRARGFHPADAVVRAVPGHVYVLRVKDGKADYHAVFRIESITPNGECSLTWKRARSPKN